MAAVKTANIGVYIQKKNILLSHHKFMVSLRHMSLYRNAKRENITSIGLPQVSSHCPFCLLNRQYETRKVALDSNYSTKSVFDKQPSSWLFVNDNKIGGEYMAQVNLDLGLEERLSEDRLPQLHENLMARNMTFDVDTLVKDFELMHEAGRTNENLKARKETLLQQIKNLTLHGKPTHEIQSLKEEMKKVQQRTKSAKTFQGSGRGCSFKCIDASQ